MAGSNVLNPVIARILDHAARCDGSPFLTLVDRHQRESSLSLGQLLSRAEHWRAHYRQAGLQPGAKVIVILEHGEDLYTSYLGALLGGHCPAYFAHPSEKVDQKRYSVSVRALLETIGGDFVVTSREISARVGLTVARGLFDDGTAFNGAAPPPRASESGRTRPLFLQFSSGTTGLKKGVAISPESLHWQVDTYAQCIDLDADDRIATWLPLYHDMGLITCFFLPLLRRIPLVAMSPFDWVRSPGMLLDAITRHRSTLVWLPNFAFNFLAARASPVDRPRWDLSSLRAIVNCSEPVLEQSHRVFTGRFRDFGLGENVISTCYALAENTFAVTTSRPRLPLVRETVAGAELAPGKEVALVPEGSAGSRTFIGSGTHLPEAGITILDGGGRELPEGHLGEIAISTPSLFSGYYRNKIDTEAVLREKWFSTGDLGYLRNGELFVIGRINDTVIVGGRNLFPQDIEAIVGDTEGVIPGRCVAFGVDEPTLGTQSLVIVAETRVTGARARRELRRRIRTAVVGVMETAPSDVALADHMWLQKSTSGKLSRSLNRQRYLEAKSLDREGAVSGPGELGSESVREGVRACVARAISVGVGRGAPEFDDHEDLLREGILDSFSLVELELALEDRFGSSAVSPIRANREQYRSVNAMAAVLSTQFVGVVAPAHPAQQPQMLRLDGGHRDDKYVLAPQMRDVEAQPYEWFAYVMRRGAPNFHSASLNTDEHGFRHTYRESRRLTFHEFAASKQPKGVVLGNSFAYGVGTSHDSRTLASVLNVLEGSRAFVWYNFAQRASVPRQERLAFELYAPTVPERIVWVTGINNLISLIVGEGLPDNPAPFVGERHFAARMMPESRYPQIPAFEQRYREMLKQLEIDISAVALRLAGIGRMLFCLQPSATWVDKGFVSEEERLIAIFDAAGATLQRAHAPENLGHLHTLFSRDVAGICKRWNVDYLDCNQDPRLRQRKWLFIDRTHMTDAGHALVAQMVTEWLHTGG